MRPSHALSPALVFTHHLEHQLDDLRGFPRPPRATALAPIVFLCHLFSIPSQDRVGCRDRSHLGQQLAAQFLAKNSQSASVSIREFQFPATELLLEDLILGLQVVHLLLQSARKPRSQPRCHELQRQRQRRTAGLVLLPAHDLPSTPFPVKRKCVGTLVKLQDPLRFSSILFWHRSPCKSWGLVLLAECRRRGEGTTTPVLGASTSVPLAATRRHRCRKASVQNDRYHAVLGQLSFRLLAEFSL
jgi:hypothetical protein